VVRDAEALPRLCALVKSDTPPIRRAAGAALGRIGKAPAIAALFDSLRAGGDRFLEHSLIYALIQIDDAKSTLPALADSSPRVRKAALIALDQMKNGGLTKELVVPLLDTADADLQYAALEVIGKRPGWANAAQAVLRKWLESPRVSVGQERALSSFLLASGGETATQEILAEALANRRTATATQSLLLDVVARSPLGSLPPTWIDGLRNVLDHAEVAIRRQAVAAVKTRNLSQLDRELVDLSRQTSMPADLRIAAIECLVRRRPQLDANSFTLLAGHLSETTEPLLRLAAARTLGASTPTNDQLVRLAGSMKDASTSVLRLLLPVFAKASDAKVGTALVESQQSAAGAEALTAAELDKTLKGYPAEVRTRAQGLREKLAIRQKGQAEYLAKLTAELAQLRGNADAGHEIFLSPKVGCYGCHRAVGRGGDVGPDLSKIGRFRSRAELLESVVFPSLTIAPEYRLYQVTTKDGRSVTGLIFRETADALHLRMTDLAEVRIARKDVEEITPSAVSLMPDGLEKTLTRQQLCDVLEFLHQQR